MRRLLVGMVAATTSLVLVATLVPMAVLISRYAVEDALARTSLEVQATESVVAFRERADLVVFIDDLNARQDDTRTTVLFEDGDAIGPDREHTTDVQRARDSGQAISSSTPDGIEVLVPARYSAGTDRTDPGSQSVAVIRVLIVQVGFFPDVLLAWTILALLGVALLVLALLVADRLARTMLVAVSGLAQTAERLEDGDLDARATPAGPVEVREVGHALNRLAGRISELLVIEREHAADLSHRLRTPLTALRLEAEDLPAPERQRVGAAIDRLTRYVDAVIDEARRPVREGLSARSDATEVVRDRADFWSALAEDQGRSMIIELPERPVLVKVSAEDLAAALDVLLENVISHTEHGVELMVGLSVDDTGAAEVVVADAGPGIDPRLLERGETSGSTGLGLDIARRTAERSGGRLVLGRRPGGGARVSLELGPAER